MLDPVFSVLVSTWDVNLFLLVLPQATYPLLSGPNSYQLRLMAQ